MRIRRSTQCLFLVVSFFLTSQQLPALSTELRQTLKTAAAHMNQTRTFPTSLPALYPNVSTGKKEQGHFI